MGGATLTKLPNNLHTMKMTPHKIVSLILLLVMVLASYSFLYYYSEKLIQTGSLIGPTIDQINTISSNNSAVADAVIELSNDTFHGLEAVTIALKFAFGMIYAIGLAVILYPWLKKDGK